MKNADEILQKIMDVVDKNGDGKIQYEGALKHSSAESKSLRHLTNGIIQNSECSWSKPRGTCSSCLDP